MLAPGQDLPLVLNSLLRRSAAAPPHNIFWAMSSARLDVFARAKDIRALKGAKSRW